jgi:phosphoglycolate phosphatase-like HAD superfamily hydrolase
MRTQSSPFGRLDPDIFRDTLQANGLDPADYSFSSFATALAAVYSSQSARLRQHGRVLPGATRALAALGKQPWAVQTILTGNVKPVALVKLATFGLDRYIDLDIGAYGADAAVRANLVGVAQRRAGDKHRVKFDSDNTVLVGDSQHDVIAGRASGVRVVAVATGQDSEDALMHLGAHVVLSDLGDTEGVLRSITP